MYSTKPLIIPLTLLLILPILSSAQKCTVPGDTQPCNNEVNITELITYVNYWYKCSDCVPDISDALNAYFGNYDSCPVVTGCSQAGSFCDNNIPYTCKINASNGCLERENGVECTGENTCLNGICVGSGSLGTTDRIEQWGITWYFDKEYEYGKFVNGDYWVTGPVTVASIDPAQEYCQNQGNSCIKDSDCREYDPWCNADNLCEYDRVYDLDFYPENYRQHFPENYLTINQEKCNISDPDIGLKYCGEIFHFYDGECIDGTCQFSRLMHGSDIDPDVNTQGFDSIAAFYNETNTEKPTFTVDPGSSLLSSISYPRIRLLYNTHIQYLDTVSVLTVLEEAPPSDAFRPQYVKGDKTIYRYSQVDRGLLPDKPDPPNRIITRTGTYYVKDKPDPADLANDFDRVWLDHYKMDGGSYRFSRPENHMPDYSAETAALVQRAILLLMLDNADDENLLQNFIQVGIDYYGSAKLDRCLWKAGDGQGNGRKAPIVFAGMMLGDESMAGIDMCSEEGHIYYYDDPDLPEIDAFGFEKRGVIGWTGAKALYGGISYRSGTNSRDFEHVQPEEWGLVKPGTPLGGCKGEGYRRCCNSYSWVGTILAMRMMQEHNPDSKALDYWNPSFVDYIDRWMTENFTSSQVDMLCNATCIIDSDGNVLQRWRDTPRPGTTPPMTSYSAFVDAMWDTYRAPGQNALDVICNTQNPRVCEPPIENKITCPQDCEGFSCTDDITQCPDLECRNAVDCIDDICIYASNDSMSCDDEYVCTKVDGCSNGNCVGIEKNHAICQNPSCTSGECDPTNRTRDEKGCIYHGCDDSIKLHLQLEENLYNMGFDDQYTEIEWLGSPSYVEGKVGSYAADLSGMETTYIKVSLNDMISYLPEVTFSIWAKKKNPDSSGILFYGGFNLWFYGNRGIIYQMANHEGIQLNYSNRTVFDDRINTDEWRHYALVYNGSHVNAYLDGNLMKSAKHTGIVGTKESSSFTIGGSGEHFNGAIDDVRLYRRALTGEEIQVLFEEGDS